MGAEFFHADGRTDRRAEITKPIAAFCNFVDAPKKEHVVSAAGVAQCSDEVTGSKIRCSKPGRDKRVLVFSKTSRPAVGPT